MKLSSIGAATALMFATSSAAAEPGDFSRFGWFAELAGSCWAGAYPDGRTSDTQCYSTQYGRFLRGTIELKSGGAKPPYLGDSVFAWDDKRARLVFHYWGSGGNHGTSEGHYEGAALVFPDPPKVDRNAPATRTVWTRPDRDSYRVTRQKKEGEAWVDDLALTYRRTEPSK